MKKDDFPSNEAGDTSDCLCGIDNHTHYISSTEYSGGSDHSCVTEISLMVVMTNKK